MTQSTYQRILTLQWHVTDACDQQCEHCYIYRGKALDELSVFRPDKMRLVVDNFVDSAHQMDCDVSFNITGGDPLLFPHIWELLEYIHSKGIRFGILGNPFHLDESVVAKLESLGCVFYQMSLDGLKDTHDFIRKSGSFDATVEAMKLFEHSKIRLTIMTTVSKLNIDEIPDLVDVVVKHKANTFGFARFCPSEGDTSQLVTPEEYRSFLERMWTKYQQYKTAKTNFTLKDHLWKLFLYEKGLFRPEDIPNPDDLILDGCHCGITHMTCLANGEVYACRRSNTPIGNALTQSFYDIFYSDAMNQYRQYEKFEACSKCELKNFCRGCPSVANSLTGNFYAKDPQCWKKFE